MNTINITYLRGPICSAFLGVRGLKFGLAAALALWSFACGILNAANGTGPDINVWRGTTQSFGNLGVPQRCVNLLGTVSDPDGVAYLSFSLNGGMSQSLSIGPDTRRLARPGDFNAELEVTNLLTGNNSVVLAARDLLGYISTITVTLHFGNESAWPLPYAIDWGAVTNLQDVVQEVDGPWIFSPDGARPLHMNYDRILAIGDMGWTDYEITVPITVHAIDPASFSSPISISPGLGLIMRWRGHSDWGAQLGGPWQPVIGWRPQGANWWYEYSSNGSGRHSLGGENGLQLLDSTYRQLGLETTYMTRTRVEAPSSGSGGGAYRFKIWDSGTPEPTSWLLEGQEDADDISSGSLLLVAHHVDATFGSLTVVPPSQFAYGIKSTVSGSGSITLSPDMRFYPKGTVVTASAVPVSGHSFSGWSGDLGGSETSATFVVDGDKAITASFSSLSGGNTSGSDEFNSPLLDTGLWTIVNPLGDAILAMTGSQLSLSLPAGTDHDTWWPGGYSVAHLTQSVANGDLQIEAKFDSILAKGYQMQGIVIEEDGDSLLRVEFHHDGAAVRLYVASFNNTAPTVRISKSIAATTRYMRVVRTGESWVIVHSSDGEGWTTEAPFSVNLAVQAAGLYVGNHTAAHTALIDYFHISTSLPLNQRPVFTTHPIIGGGATEGAPYSDSLTANDPDLGDTLTYALESASTWLAVAVNGTLSGTPENRHVGLNEFMVKVTDAAGRFDTAKLQITVAPATIGDFSAWLTGNRLPADPLIDSDGDSISNIIEYIIDGDPGNRNDLNLLPTVQLVLADPDGNSTASEYILFAYRRSHRAAIDPIVNIKVEWTTALETQWSAADDGSDGVVILPDDNAAADKVDLVRVYIPRSLEGNGKLFARLSGAFITP